MIKAPYLFMSTRGSGEGDVDRYSRQWITAGRSSGQLMGRKETA